MWEGNNRTLGRAAISESHWDCSPLWSLGSLCLTKEFLSKRYPRLGIDVVTKRHVTFGPTGKIQGRVWIPKLDQLYLLSAPVTVISMPLFIACLYSCPHAVPLLHILWLFECSLPESLRSSSTSCPTDLSLPRGSFCVGRDVFKHVYMGYCSDPKVCSKGWESDLDWLP